MRGAFGQARCWDRAKTLALSALVGFGRSTVTGLICTAGRQFLDWTGDYRLFSRSRFDGDALFAPVHGGILDLLESDAPLVAAMDDTLFHKTGRKVHGVAYRRAPLGYRLSRRSRILYRQPAYLICTDPQRPLEQFLQYYPWRGGIENNFREDKTLLKAGQAQLRLPLSVHAVPALIVAA